MTDEKYWFEPKARGYGAGLPVAWQGWVLLGVYTLVLSAGVAILLWSIAAYVVLFLVATALLLMIAAAKTRGGWRWRSGGEG